ncbi:ATP-binding protein [Chloroflexota bacterium]
MVQRNSSGLTVNIRPEVSVYATYRRLSYKPWYAVAEFVDNSTQNYYDNRRKLLGAYKQERARRHLVVEITYDSTNNSLIISDNAYGMEAEEITRALVLNRPPPNTDGRCEFGMGLKTAACWFGTTWMIQTSQLGSDRKLSATVHVPELVSSKSENIPVKIELASKDIHFTHITLNGLYKPLRGKTLTRIREQLASIYREDLRTGEVEILWNGIPMGFEEPPILNEDLGGGINRVWRKNIVFSVRREEAGEDLEAQGWVGIRIPANQRDAGFVLMRHGRVITGGPGEGYKPEEIFGQGNTYRSQRLVGELHMDSWPVTQAKDAFDWSGGLEDEFILELKKASQEYMSYAEGYRQNAQKVTATDMELASEKTRTAFSDKRFGEAVAEELQFPDPVKTELQEKADTEKIQAMSDGPVQFRLDVGTSLWTFRLHWQDQLSDAHWMQVSYPQDNEIDVFLNMAHPFFAPYLGNKDFLELLQKFVLSLALAERMARETATNGLISPSDFRMYMNKVLRRASEIEADDGG